MQVNSVIIDIASIVYECDLFEDERAASFQHGSKELKEVSGIDSKNWDMLKLASALKLICYPEDEIVTGDSEEVNRSG
jgi:nucleolar protein 58